MAQTGEGAASQISSNLTRMKELAAQAATGTYSDSQKATMQKEFESLAEEVNRVANSTEFNGNKMLHADGETVEVSIGNGSTISIDSADMTYDASGVDLVNNAEAVLSDVEAAIENTNEHAAYLGTQSARLESASKVQQIKVENQMAAEARIAHADFAFEVAKNANAQVQSQAAIAMLAQGNTMSSMVLQLLG